ncbi:C39 family peptidase [Streptomonospora wellingtoniae]|uniref:C39 family peptidase n=1 Tax=Streptomonospora wellingtoniae TaxID=3075544 RepID=A0ABU2KN91_9ACTN|nr:C39 family peptidase [Streptomonospora sp. DSM 45055]MDT0300736.1 C39 family peptidase [Streptomonospora sp. DSM 45055]
MHGFRLAVGALGAAGVLMAGAVPAAADPATTASPGSTVVGGSQAPAPTASTLAEPPVRYEVKHKAWEQKEPSWCAPASVQLSLRTFGVYVTQDTLADKMDTDSVGTSGADMERVYDSYLEDEGYEMSWSTAQDPDALMDAVSYDVGVLHKAIPLGVWGAEASWIGADENFGHVVSVRGYDQEEDTFTIWDPWLGSYGGHHTVSADDLADAAQKNGLAYVHEL